MSKKYVLTNRGILGVVMKEAVTLLLLLEDYDWCKPTVCKNCKSNYANREDSLTCPCLDEY